MMKRGLGVHSVCALLSAILPVAGIGLLNEQAAASTIAEIEALSSGTTCTLDSNAVVSALLHNNGATWSFLVNDGTGSLALYGSLPGGYTPTLGDIVHASGTYSPYRQIPEVGTLTAITLISSGNPVPPPIEETILDLNVNPLPLTIAGYYITVRNVSIQTSTGGTPTGNFPTGSIEYRIDDGTNHMVLYYWPTSYSVSLANLGGKPIPTWPVDVTGIMSVYTNGTPEFTPISISSPPGVFGVAGTASPNPIQAGELVTLTATVNPGVDPTSTGIVVTADLSLIGGPNPATFTLDGPLPDGTISFTYQMITPCGLTAGDYNLPLHAADAELRSADSSIPIAVQAGSPSIEFQPSNNVVCAGGTARFSVVAHGTAITYQWYDAGGALSDGDTGTGSTIAGATTASLAIANVGQADVDAGPYHVVVTGDCPDPGSTLTSDSKTLSLGTAATAEQKQIVISQVYGGGGNAGATIKCDFIELFNKGTTPVTLDRDWSVQYASTDLLSSTTPDTGPHPSFATPVRMTIIPAGTTIQPGHYFLIREGYGGGGTVDITPDLDGTALPNNPILIGYNGGKIALVNNPTPLTGTCPVDDANCTIVDYLGWDNWTLCYEGSGAAPYTSNTSSVVRNSACTDTDDNAADFTFTYAIVPHNSSTPAAPTIVTQPADQAACVGQTATFTVGADGPCLTYQWQVYTGGAWTNVTTGTGGDTASYTTDTIAAGDIGKQYRVILSNPYGPDATSNAAAIIDGTPSPEDHQIVINQIYGGGGNTGAPYQNDFIELYNKGTTAVDVTGWSLQYASAGGMSWTNTTVLSGVIQPGQFYLIQEAAGTSCSGGPCGVPLPVTPDLIDDTPINLSGTAGKLVLLKSTDVLPAVSCPADGDCRAVDFVGYGTTASCYEGTRAPAPSNTKSVIRNPLGRDTDDNGADFIVVDPQLTHYAPGDFNEDGYVNDADFDLLAPCVQGPTVLASTDCQNKDLDGDHDVDQDDFGLFQRCFSGSNVPQTNINCVKAQ